MRDQEPEHPAAGERRLTTREAAELLGVKPETVYAYVSRGQLGSRRTPGGRGSTFDAKEVRALARRNRRDSGTPAASGQELAVRTRITLIESDRFYYRGVDAVELAARHSYEEVAEWLWTGRLRPRHRLRRARGLRGRRPPGRRRPARARRSRRPVARRGHRRRGRGPAPASTCPRTPCWAPHASSSPPSSPRCRPYCTPGTTRAPSPIASGRGSAAGRPTRRRCTHSTRRSPCSSTTTWQPPRSPCASPRRPGRTPTRPCPPGSA